MKPLSQEQIDKASAWWAEAVCNPQFIAEEPGHETAPTVFANVLARHLVKHVTNHQKLTFRQELAKALEAAERRSVMCIGVDYHADPFLADVAQKAGIPESNFPWKTNMWLSDDGTVTVRAGYHGEMVEL